MVIKHFSNFEDLTPADLYNLLKLRQDVFIIEQDCIYEDIDGLDIKSEHVLIYHGEQKLAAYARIVPAGLKFDEISIGRIVVNPEMRKMGLGKLLMRKILEMLKNRNVKHIKIEAQVYLENFYQPFGFKKVSEPFDLDGIPHIEMSLKF